MKFHVEPVSADVKVPPHPTEGPLPPEGAYWLADQYTLRLIVDGVIRRKADDTDEAALERMQPRKAAPVAASADDPVKGGEDAFTKPLADLKAQLPAPIDAAPADPGTAPGPGTVASVPFMITATQRKQLKALGKTDAEIAQMKPEDAQAILAASDAAPAAPAPKEA